MNLPYAHTPILPADTFVPDVDAHVWEDGRLCLYDCIPDGRCVSSGSRKIRWSSSRRRRYSRFL